MSFIPPVVPPTPLDYEVARAKQDELEVKAARYAQLHPSDHGGEESVGPIGRALRRVRAALASRR